MPFVTPSRSVGTVIAKTNGRAEASCRRWAARNACKCAVCVAWEALVADGAGSGVAGRWRRDGDDE